MMLSETLRRDTLPIVELPAEPVSLAAPAARVIRPRRRSLVISLLLLLTLIGGGLRFLSLDRPSVWGDEAATYGRVAGSYQDLLDQLVDSSFPPLHYESLWWLSQGMPYWGHVVPRDDQPAGTKDPAYTFVPTKFLVPGGIRLTPFFLRLFPAIAGTLFIPAMYFLTRQLFGPRVSLTAAFLACFSAYLLVYSRDAKMYMPFWTWCVTNVACLLWWLRARRTLPWLGWIVSGAAMLGWHASGLMLLAIEGIIFFTSPQLNWRKLGTVGGLFFWPILAVPMYAAERLRRRLEWRDWLRWPKFLSWPRRAWSTFAMPAAIPFSLGLLVILSTMFGPVGFYSAFDKVYQKVSGDNRPAVDTGSLGIDWVGRYNMGRDLSGYLLYTSSAFLTGWEWPRHIPAVGLDDQAKVYPRTLRLLQIGTVGLLGLLAIGLLPWQKAFSPGRARLNRIRQERLVFPPFRRRRVLWIAVWLTAIPWIVYTQSVQRPANVLDGFASIVLTNPPSPRWPRALNIPAPDATRTATFRRWSEEIKKAWPAEWDTYRAAFHDGNYSTAGIVIAVAIALIVVGLTTWKWRSIGRGALELVAVTVTLVVLGSVIAFLPKWLDNDVWMPRYLGVVFPAVLIFAAVLIARQPTRWLTGVTLGLFLIVNLSQFGARVFGRSEAPLAIMAADLIAAQPQSVIPQNPTIPAFRDFTELGFRQIAEPGGSALFNGAGNYYLHILSGFKDRARLVRQGEFDRELMTWYDASPNAIVKDLKQSPAIQSFAVWTLVPAFQVDQSDAVGDRLVGHFRKVSDEIWPVADHWRWVQYPKVRRRLFEKLPTTQPLK